MLHETSEVCFGQVVRMKYPLSIIIFHYALADASPQLANAGLLGYKAGRQRPNPKFQCPSTYELMSELLSEYEIST